MNEIAFRATTNALGALTREQLVHIITLMNHHERPDEDETAILFLEANLRANPQTNARVAKKAEELATQAAKTWNDLSREKLQEFFREQLMATALQGVVDRRYLIPILDEWIEVIRITAA